MQFVSSPSPRWPEQPSPLPHLAATHAQQFGVAVHIGGPYRPAPRFVASYHRGFYAEGRYWADRRAYDDYCRHREWERVHHDRFGWR